MRWKALDDFLKPRGAEANRWLGEKLDVAGATVSRWRARTRRPDDDTLLDIERATGGKVPATSWISEISDARKAEVSADGRAA